MSMKYTDFGGGTLDCSVLRCIGYECQVLSIHGDTNIGGIDFDHIIYEMMVYKFKLYYNWEIYSELKSELIKISERVKRTLTYNNMDKIVIYNEKLNEKKEITIYRDEFENNPKTIDLINRVIFITNETINEHDYSNNNEISMILLIGGSSNIPIIQYSLKNTFKKYGIKLINDPNYDTQLMVVTGTGIIAGSLAYDTNNNNNEQIIIEDVIPLSLGFSICEYDNNLNKNKCGIFDPIILKNSEYPTNKIVKYCQNNPNSNVAVLKLYEGTSKYVINNYFLMKLQINNIPKRKANECNNIHVIFNIDGNGIATINAKINNNKEINLFNESLSIINNVNNNGTNNIYSNSQLNSLKHQMISWYDNDISKKIFSS